LFAAILHRLWDATCTVGVSAYRADVPLREQLLVLLDRKLRLLSDEAFLALARVAIGAVIHSPERSRDMVERIGEREEDLTVWIRAAAAAGRLSAPDPEFAAHQLHGIVKAFAFWPQVTLGQPPLEVPQQQKVAQAAADMFHVLRPSGRRGFVGAGAGLIRYPMQQSRAAIGQRADAGPRALATRHQRG
jgi:TetR/AcrR family transcriptional regulator of autoinduction and epiphytic fitness